MIQSRHRCKACGYLSQFAFLLAFAVAAFPQVTLADQRNQLPLQVAYNAGEMCEIKATRDGFVALRKGPSVRHGRIKKLIAGVHRISVVGPIGRWVKVDVAIPEGRAAGDWSGTGYVFAKLIDWRDCGLAG